MDLDACILKYVIALGLIYIYIYTGYNGVEGILGQHHKGHKLFVFGDSYSDTGNDNKTEVHSWSVPYGITFPGNPTGRFSDGRVLTDFIGSLPCPILSLSLSHHILSII